MKNYVTRWKEIVEDVSRSAHPQSVTAATKLDTYWGLLTQAERQRLSDSLHTSRAFRSNVDDDRESRRMRRAIVAVLAVMGPMPRNTVEAKMRDLRGNLGGLLYNFIARLVDHFPNEITYPWPAVNCYAYAMRCRNPGGRRGGTAVPGIAAGLAPYNQGNHVKVTLGAVADGAHFAGMRRRPPFQPPANRYFIALFTRPGGFHWIRRDNRTGLWSWKEGNGGRVQGSVARTPAADDIAPRKMHRYIRDAMIPDLLQGEYRPWNTNDVFRGLFAVPSVGLPVSAP